MCSFHLSGNLSVRLLVLLLLFSASANAQRRGAALQRRGRTQSSAAQAGDKSRTAPTCSLKLAQAPAIRGLRLGMTVDQVSEFFPQVKSAKEDMVGIAQAGRIPIALSRKKSDFEGIEAFSFGFLDQRLTSLGVEYDKSVTWDNVDQFTNRLSEALGLPKAWKMNREQETVAATEKNRRPALPDEISKVAVEADARQQVEDDSNRYLTCDGFWMRAAIGQLFIADSSVEEKVNKRLADRSEQRRKEFKP